MLRHHPKDSKALEIHGHVGLDHQSEDMLLAGLIEPVVA
jgi:hypothetical protein